VACRAVGVSQAWFYKWRRGDVCVRRKRPAALAALLFAAHHGSYGSPRIWRDLPDSGWRVSKNTAAALMAEKQPRRPTETQTLGTDQGRQVGTEGAGCVEVGLDPTAAAGCALVR
jgi:hypothetical protein